MKTIRYEVWEALCQHGNHSAHQIGKRLGYPQQTMKNALRNLVMGHHVMQVKYPGSRAMQYAPLINNPPKEEGIERIIKKPADTAKPEQNTIALMPLVRGV